MTNVREITDRDGKVHTFPPRRTREYTVVDGRIATRSLEAHVVDHCNLTCAECCSLSPFLPRWMATPEALARDLALAARALAPRVFKLVGGEPLLHPQLAELLRAARDAAIAPVLSVTTNGLLLPRMSDAVWKELDALTISLYPAPALPSHTISLVEEKAARFGVDVNWKTQNEFVRMTLAARRLDEAENTRVYDECWLRERCHMVRDGVFYTCTRPPHFQSFFGDRPFTADGLRLDSYPEEGGPEEGGLAQRLLGYLRRKEPLEACYYCTGGDAAMTPHRQLSREEINQQRPHGA